MDHYVVTLVVLALVTIAAMVIAAVAEKSEEIGALFSNFCTAFTNMFRECCSAVRHIFRG